MPYQESPTMMPNEEVENRDHVSRRGNGSTEVKHALSLLSRQPVEFSTVRILGGDRTV